MRRTLDSPKTRPSGRQTRTPKSGDTKTPRGQRVGSPAWRQPHAVAQSKSRRRAGSSVSAALSGTRGDSTTVSVSSLATSADSPTFFRRSGRVAASPSRSGKAGTRRSFWQMRGSSRGMPSPSRETLQEAFAAVDFITQRGRSDGKGGSSGRGDGARGGVDAPGFYNTDAGNSMTLSTSVLRSPIKFSSCRSSTARFAPPAEVLDVTYNTDTGSKVTIATAARKSPRTVPSFRSKTPRICPSPLPPGNLSAVYNTDCGPAMTVSSRCARSSMGLAAISPGTPRFPPTISSACDAGVGPGSYQPDNSGTSPPRANPAELALQKYLKRRSQLRHHPQQAKSGRDAFGAGLGPGCYDGAVNPPKRLRPHSPSFIFSEKPRFEKRPAGQPPLYGNTPTVFARDRKAWSKSVYIDAQGNRPSMVDRNMVDLIGTLKTDTLHKATIATSVARSPLKYSASFRSKECRLADLRNEMSFYPKDKVDRPAMGPGDYDAHLVKDMMMSRTRVEARTWDDWGDGVPARMDLRLLSDQFATLQPRTAFRRRSILSPAMPITADTFWGSKRAEYPDEVHMVEDSGTVVSGGEPS